MRPSLHRLPILLAVFALFAAACSSSVASPSPTSMASPGSLTLGTAHSASLGDYLTGPTGMTLYANNLDTANTSTCSGTCATNWPPLTVTPGTIVTGPAGASGVFGFFMRADGTTQVSYNGLPLHYFAGDSVAGDTTGAGKSDQGPNTMWFVTPLSGVLPATVGASASAMTSGAPSAMASAPASMAPSPSTSSGY